MDLKSFETMEPYWGQAKENGIIQSRKTLQRKECLRPGTGGWNHDALERPSHPKTAAGSQLPDDPDPRPLLHAAQCGDFLDLRDGEPEPQQRLILYLAGKWPTLSIQFELTRLRVRSDHYDPDKPRPLLLVSDHLEDQGLRVLLEQNGQPFYVTEGQQPDEIRTSTLQQVPEGRGGISWGKKGVAFYYHSLQTGVECYVIGADPLVESDDRFSMYSKELFKGSFIGAFLLVMLAAALAGLALSRLMAVQLLKPLGKLRRVASQVSRGDLDTPVKADSRDEIGDTLRAFELTRQELRHARERREQYDRSRKEMLAGIAHDLATPLTKIQGYASGLQDGIADTPEKQQRYLQKILETTESMAKLNQTLFLFSKLDLDQVPFQWETVDLCRYLADYVEEQRDHWAQNGLQIVLESTLDRAPVRMDRGQFARVLDNLLSNSWKYKTEKTGKACFRLTSSGLGRVRLELADNGSGVAPDQLDRIFESFYRTDRARSHVAAGSGLGLAVVRKIVETMKGKIWAEANEPQGLKICMEFSLEESNQCKRS